MTSVPGPYGPAEVCDASSHAAFRVTLILVAFRPFRKLIPGVSTNAAADIPQADGAYDDASDCATHSAVSIFRATIPFLCVLYHQPSCRKQ